MSDALVVDAPWQVAWALDDHGVRSGRARWVIRWKAALNAFAITFEREHQPVDQLRLQLALTPKIRRSPAVGPGRREHRSGAALCRSAKVVSTLPVPAREKKESPVAVARARSDSRVEWLDGVRALAALFVVLHHVWLLTIGGYPGNNGPWATNFLVYGHLAVAVFIVVSGFSLTLRPARNGGLLSEGALGFFERRFWRIVPPYWVALVLSVVLLWSGLRGDSSGSTVGFRDVGIHALLLQDTVQSKAPNGAFWSIAIEWHIYFLFPLVLWSFRRFGPIVTPLSVGALVVAQYSVGGLVPLVGAFGRFTPQFLVLFMLGAAAVALVGRQGAARCAVWVAVSCGVAMVPAFAVAGPAAVVGAYFWVDIAVGFAVAAAFLAMAEGRFQWLRDVLANRWLVAIGSFAFSIYLIHVPVLDLVLTHLVEGANRNPTEEFWLLLVVGFPAAIAVSYLFFLAFERPFVRFRGFSARRAAPTQADLPPRPRSAVTPPPEDGDPSPAGTLDLTE